MSLRIAEEGPGALEKWAEVPIRFVVKSRCVIGPGGVMSEVPVDPPYVYDYDALEPPRLWRSWDLAHWGFFSAMEGGARVGGAAVAFRTPGLEMLENRDDVACLWDIRVDPEHRGAGIGRALCEHAARWAAGRGARLLRVETQDINAPACRFYGRRGFRLTSVRPGAYATHPDQTQLIWTRLLAPADPMPGNP